MYLLRFDDICPTMNWGVWEEIEAVLKHYQVRPLLAVVPDNRDPRLCVDPPGSDFWDRVRSWQERGWTIALHGYQHVYVNRSRGIMGLTPSSEFAGLDGEAQAQKLAAGCAIFERNGVRPAAWVAPSHSFDWTTVGLLPKFGIRVISDGLWRWPHTDKRDIVWIPQQLWKFKEKGAGVWTVCCHHNAWSAAEIQGFRRDVGQFAARLSSAEEVVKQLAGRGLRFSDKMRALGDLCLNHRLRPFLGRTLRLARGKLPETGPASRVSERHR